MDGKDVGCFFTTTGEDVWELIAFCEHPSVTLLNLKTSRRISGASDSLDLQPFIKLKPEKPIKSGKDVRAIK